MKRFWTSNYTRNGAHPLAFSISVVAPKSFKGQMIRELAPTWDLVKRYKDGKVDERQYTIEYLALLAERNIDVENLINKLPNGAILLCYESPNDFCHRHIVRKWLLNRSDSCTIQETLNSFKDNDYET